MTKTFKRIVSAITLYSFVATNSAWGMPQAGIEMIPQRETPGFFHIEIPEHLASIEEIYQAPAKPDARLILHVQNAHGNYEAQSKIKELLDYLYKTYGFKLIFVEGAAEPLNADYLKLFPDAERNTQLADYLAQKGELTGAELYLMNAPSDVHAVGIEKTGLYRANYEAFKKVYGAKSDSDNFLAGLGVKLERLASRFYSPEARRLLSEWGKFEEGRREFLPYVKHLSVDAQKILALDLESIFAQVEWPQMTRLLVIQSMEKDLNREAALTEKARLVEFLKSKNVSKTVIQSIDTFEEKKITVNRASSHQADDLNSPRYLLEHLVEDAGPKGFYFHDYPSFSLYAGYLILKSELDSKNLFKEIELLFDKILNEVTKTEMEKNLLELFRDQKLLTQLIHLELNRGQWQRAVYRREWINPDAMSRRVQRLESGRIAVDMIQGPGEKELAPLAEIFDTAFKFYDLAHERESVFYHTLRHEMAQQKSEKAVLITGGFHTDGLTELFRQDEVSFGTLMPRLTQKPETDNYISTMMETHKTIFDIANIEEVIKFQSSRRSRIPSGASARSEVRLVVDGLLNVYSHGSKPTLDELNGILESANGSAFAKDRGIDFKKVRSEARLNTYQVNENGKDGETLSFDVSEASDGRFAFTARIWISDNRSLRAPEGILSLQGGPEGRRSNLASPYVQLAPGVRAELRQLTPELLAKSGKLKPPASSLSATNIGGSVLFSGRRAPAGSEAISARSESSSVRSELRTFVSLNRSDSRAESRQGSEDLEDYSNQTNLFALTSELQSLRRDLAQLYEHNVVDGNQPLDPKREEELQLKIAQISQRIRDLKSLRQSVEIPDEVRRNIFTYVPPEGTNSNLKESWEVMVTRALEEGYGMEQDIRMVFKGLINYDNGQILGRTIDRSEPGHLNVRVRAGGSQEEFHIVYEPMTVERALSSVRSLLLSLPDEASLQQWREPQNFAQTEISGITAENLALQIGQVAQKISQAVAEIANTNNLQSIAGITENLSGIAKALRRFESSSVRSELGTSVSLNRPDSRAESRSEKPEKRTAAELTGRDFNASVSGGLVSDTQSRSTPLWRGSQGFPFYSLLSWLVSEGYSRIASVTRRIMERTSTIFQGKENSPNSRVASPAVTMNWLYVMADLAINRFFSVLNSFMTLISFLIDRLIDKQATPSYEGASKTYIKNLIFHVLEQLRREDIAKVQDQSFQKEVQEAIRKIEAARAVVRTNPVPAQLTVAPQSLVQGPHPQADTDTKVASRIQRREPARRSGLQGFREVADLFNLPAPKKARLTQLFIAQLNAASVSIAPAAINNTRLTALTAAANQFAGFRSEILKLNAQDKLDFSVAVDPESPVYAILAKYQRQGLFEQQDLNRFFIPRNGILRQVFDALSQTRVSKPQPRAAAQPFVSARAGRPANRPELRQVKLGFDGKLFMDLELELKLANSGRDLASAAAGYIFGIPAQAAEAPAIRAGIERLAAAVWGLRAPQFLKNLKPVMDTFPTIFAANDLPGAVEFAATRVPSRSELRLAGGLLAAKRNLFIEYTLGVDDPATVAQIQINVKAAQDEWQKIFGEDFDDRFQIRYAATSSKNEKGRSPFVSALQYSLSKLPAKLHERLLDQGVRTGTLSDLAQNLVLVTEPGISNLVGDIVMNGKRLEVRLTAADLNDPAVAGALTVSGAALSQLGFVKAAELTGSSLEELNKWQGLFGIIPPHLMAFAGTMRALMASLNEVYVKQSA